MPKKPEKKRTPGRPRISPGGAVVIPASVPRELAVEFDRRRKKEGLTRSAAVTAALREWLAT